jgi:hypothetical protein
MSDDSEVVVSTYKFWTYVATPLFLAILAFGIYVVFALSPIQFATRDRLDAVITELKRWKPRGPAGAASK